MDMQSVIEPNLLEWLASMDYIRHSDGKWQITSDGVRKSLFYQELSPEKKEVANFMYNFGL